MLQLITDHPLLFKALVGLVSLDGVALILILATRYRGHHRGEARSAAVRHAPRHAAGTPRPVYAPRHEVADTGAVELGQRVDGDLTFVHAPAPAEPAVEVRPDDEPTVQLHGGLVAA